MCQILAHLNAPEITGKIRIPNLTVEKNDVL
jgi:hypothetical protein